MEKLGANHHSSIISTRQQYQYPKILRSQSNPKFLSQLFMWQTISSEEESVDFCKNEKQSVTIYHVNINSCNLIHGTKITFF